jgi:hypothetical protein
MRSMWQIMATRDVPYSIIETCIADGLNLNRLWYVKWLVINGKLDEESIMR